MDSLFVLAGVLGVGDLLLARVWWHERRKRRRAERAANASLRENLRLMDEIDHWARPVAKGDPVIVRMPVKPKQIREAIAELKGRQVAETGGAS
jgi:hypothetical protein